MKKLLLLITTVIILSSCGKKNECLENANIKNEQLIKQRDKEILNYKKECDKKNKDIDSIIRIVNKTIDTLNIIKNEITTQYNIDNQRDGLRFIYTNQPDCSGCSKGETYLSQQYYDEKETYNIVMDWYYNQIQILNKGINDLRETKINDVVIRRKEEEIKNKYQIQMKANISECDQYKY